jgi:Pyridoxamine 5'-phosphate oxidase
MATWSEVVTAAPELAARVRERFEAHGLAFLATLRRDGSPRISGLEPLFALDELWLGMMPGSRKAADLLRDPRFALHSASADKQVSGGDAKLSGTAIPVTQANDLERYAKAFEVSTGYAPGSGPFTLFRANVLELSFLVPAGDHLDISWWREGSGTKTVARS